MKLILRKVINYKSFLLGGMIFLCSCKSMKTPYGKSYVEYQKKSFYNNIEYSIEKGNKVYYLENTLENKTYLLWISSKDSLNFPKSEELPKGFYLSGVTHLIPAKFNLNYRHKVKLLNDQFQNIYIRIH